MSELTIDREQLLALVKESGIMDELRAEMLDSMPMQNFSSPDGDAEFGAGMGQGGLPWNYWKRLDGDVVWGPSSEREIPTYGVWSRKGYKHLPQYGLLPTPGSKWPCESNMACKEQPLHGLMANGGAKELSIRQIISAGWHLKAPVVHNKTIVFPQLKDVEIEDIECPECDKRISGIKGTNEVLNVFRQHSSAAHGFARREVDEALWSIGYLAEEKPRPPRRRRIAEPVE